MNAEPNTQDQISSIALTVASVVYGGVEEKSMQWDRCMEVASAIFGVAPAAAPRNRWLEARQSFETVAAFNKNCPPGTEGIIQPSYGPQMTTSVQQPANLFPHPREGQLVMAWFQNVGWAEVSRFQPMPKKFTLAEELTAAGKSAKQNGKLDLAKAIFLKALDADPTYWHALNEIGVILVSENKYEEAVEYYERALIQNPTCAEAINNRGTALRMLGKTAEAISDLMRAAELMPDHDMIPLNLSSAIEDTGDYAGAMKVLDDRIRKSATDYNAQYNKGLLMLSCGHLAEGWPQHISRLSQPLVNTHYEHYGYPRVTDGPVTGVNVLVWAEQGLGDEIMTASMLPDLMREAQSVVFLCQERLVSLMKRSFPKISVDARPTGQYVDLFQRQRLRPELMPRALREFNLINCQMSQSDLGAVYRSSFDKFPKHGGFLKADTTRALAYRSQIEGVPCAKKLVGISWHSAKNPRIGDLKTIKLGRWRDILTTPGVQFVNLQYGNTDEIVDVEKEYGIKIARIEDLNFEKDLDGFASLVAAMDLVISTSNTTVHFAGGLNVPCWVMTPHGPGKLWYLFTGSEELPWYPSCRLYRQKASSQWGDVLTRVAADLREWSEH